MVAPRRGCARRWQPAGALSLQRARQVRGRASCIAVRASVGDARPIPGLRCLLVEDSDGFLASATRLLESQRMAVVGLRACSGAEAVALAVRLRPEVALVDVELGEEDRRGGQPRARAAGPRDAGRADLLRTAWTSSATSWPTAPPWVCSAVARRRRDRGPAGRALGPIRVLLGVALLLGRASRATRPRHSAYVTPPSTAATRIETASMAADGASSGWYSTDGGSSFAAGMVTMLRTNWRIDAPMLSGISSRSRPPQRTTNCTTSPLGARDAGAGHDRRHGHDGDRRARRRAARARSRPATARPATRPGRGRWRRRQRASGPVREEQCRGREPGARPVAGRELGDRQPPEVRRDHVGDARGDLQHAEDADELPARPGSVPPSAVAVTTTPTRLRNESRKTSTRPRKARLAMPVALAGRPVIGGGSDTRGSYPPRARPTLRCLSRR